MLLKRTLLLVRLTLTFPIATEWTRVPRYRHAVAGEASMAVISAALQRCCAQPKSATVLRGRIARGTPELLEGGTFSVTAFINTNPVGEESPRAARAPARDRTSGNARGHLDGDSEPEQIGAPWVCMFTSRGIGGHLSILVQRQAQQWIVGEK